MHISIQFTIVQFLIFICFLSFIKKRKRTEDLREEEKLKDKKKRPYLYIVKRAIVQIEKMCSRITHTHSNSVKNTKENFKIYKNRKERKIQEKQLKQKQTENREKQQQNTNFLQDAITSVVTAFFFCSTCSSSSSLQKQGTHILTLIPFFYFYSRSNTYVRTYNVCV